MENKKQKVLVTGSNGFIGKNLLAKLAELNKYSVVTFTRDEKKEDLKNLVEDCDFVIHLAGENRPSNTEDFKTVNVELTLSLCEAIANLSLDRLKKIKLIHISSIQAGKDNAYGRSKKAGEKIVEQLAKSSQISASIYRLPGVFGKWCRPNYNSVVATFCYNVANNIPIEISDPNYSMQIVYIDDVINKIINECDNLKLGVSYCKIEPVYTIKLKNLAKKIQNFEKIPQTLLVGKVGTSLDRALYSTFLSYLPKPRFKYALKTHVDERGKFVEMLKTVDSGQFSYFTALPGVTRGGHYHHTKSEKFLVVSGRAKFRFQHILTKDLFEFEISGEKPEVIDTIPGWIHDIKNIGDKELVVLLWANEVFTPKNPDTYMSEIEA